MKNILFAMVLTMAGRAYAVDFNDLGTVKVPDLKAVAAADSTVITPGYAKGHDGHDNPGNHNGWNDGPGGHNNPGNHNGWNDGPGGHNNPGNHNGWNDGPGGHNGHGWPGWPGGHNGPEYEQVHRSFQTLVQWAPRMDTWQVLEARRHVLDQLNYLNGVRPDVMRGVVRWIKWENRLEQVRGTLNFLINKNGFPFIQGGARHLLRKVDGGW